MAANPMLLAGTFLAEGAAVAWGVWELWKLRPRKDDAAEDSSAFARSTEPSDSPEAPGHAEGQHGAHDGRTETIEG